MATRIVEWSSADKLACSLCLPADVILCIRSELLPQPNPDYPHTTINATITLVKSSVCTCSKTYTYVIEYDDTQVLEGTELIASDISGVLCSDCLVAWVTDNLGDFVPYVGAYKSVDLGVWNLTTTGELSAGHFLGTKTVTDSDWFLYEGDIVATITTDTIASQLFIQGTVSQNIADTKTNLGTLAGGYLSVLRNNSFGPDDNGTLSTLQGLVLRVGHTSNGLSAPITTDIYGLIVNKYLLTGTAGSIYGVYIPAELLGIGTATTSYGVFVDQQAGGGTNWQFYSANGNSYAGGNNSELIFGDNYNASVYYNGTNFIVDPKKFGAGILDVLGVLQTDGYKSADGTSGASGTITIAGLTSITVKNGLITAWA